MATTITKFPAVYKSADAVDEEIIFDEPIFNADPFPIIKIEVKTGAWAFDVGAVAEGSSSDYVATDTLNLTLKNGRDKKLNLHAICTTAGKIIRITY